MPKLSWNRSISSLRTFSQSLWRWLEPYVSSILIVAGATILGVSLAIIAQFIEPGDRVVVGNTAGTLTVLIESNQQRLLIGAGPSRSHAADLIGRSTRPWDRTVDLLILPGWDDHHVAGAIGLIERRSIDSIAVIGIPGNEPAWTLLERASSDFDIPLRYVDHPSSLDLDSRTSLLMSELDGDRDGAWLRFDYQGMAVDVIDSAETARARPDPRAADPVDDHLVISTRRVALPDASSPSVGIVAQPHWDFEFTELDAQYLASIDRNDRLTIGIDTERFRIHQDDLEPGMRSADP